VFHLELARGATLAPVIGRLQIRLLANEKRAETRDSAVRRLAQRSTHRSSRAFAGEHSPVLRDLVQG